MDLGLQGRRYVVTGGSRGLGLATARALAADGARTWLVARHADRLREAAESLGPDHGFTAIDVAVEGAAEAIADAVGPIDGVLVNVGGPPAGGTLDLSDAQWREAIDGVLLATVRVLRTLSAQVVEGGSILVVLSTTAREPIAGLGASNALRPGLAMVVKELSNTLAPAIRVNGIMPGRIATDRLMAVASGDVGEGVPLGRVGEPAEFGRVAAFLLSPAASYVTGAILAVDGGLLRSAR